MGAQYEFDIAQDQALTLRADYNYRSKFYFEPGEGNIAYGVAIPLTTEKGYGLLDLRATCRMGNWTAEAFATNITEKQYRNSENLVANTLLAFPGEPRVFGGRLTWRY